MGDDAAAIRRVTSKLAFEGRQIVLVMHSYGGIRGTESAKGLARKIRQAEGKPGGIIALVYLCAYLVKEGMSVNGLANGAEWPTFLAMHVCFPLLSQPFFETSMYLS
jgi:pimeloyl-ACP methyl ester carboxylesterase